MSYGSGPYGSGPYGGPTIDAVIVQGTGRAAGSSIAVAHSVTLGVAVEQTVAQPVEAKGGAQVERPTLIQTPPTENPAHQAGLDEPPARAEGLLKWLFPRSQHAMIGCLAEMRHEYAMQHGDRWASALYWWQVIRSIVPLRFAWLAAAVGWLFGRFGS